MLRNRCYSLDYLRKAGFACRTFHRHRHALRSPSAWCGLKYTGAGYAAGVTIAFGGKVPGCDLVPVAPD